MSSGSARPERIVLRYGALLSRVTLDRVRESSFSSFEASDAGCSQYQRDDNGGNGWRDFCGVGTQKAWTVTFYKAGQQVKTHPHTQTRRSPAARANNTDARKHKV